jgi:hypothetical protein
LPAASSSNSASSVTASRSCSGLSGTSRGRRTVNSRRADSTDRSLQRARSEWPCRPCAAPVVLDPCRGGALLRSVALRLRSCIGIKRDAARRERAGPLYKGPFRARLGTGRFAPS